MLRCREIRKQVGADGPDRRQTGNLLKPRSSGVVGHCMTRIVDIVSTIVKLRKPQLNVDELARVLGEQCLQLKADVEAE